MTCKGKNDIKKELASDKYYEVEVVASKTFIVKVKDVEDAEDLVEQAATEAVESGTIEISSYGDGYDSINVLEECGDDMSEDIEVGDEYYDW